jgi:hypothetical protein
MSRYTDELLANAGKRTKAKRARMRPPPSPDYVPSLDDVAFGSFAARELAEALGLTFDDFASSAVTPTGASGYVLRDVRDIHADV